jgi:hypothetical protein
VDFLEGFRDVFSHEHLFIESEERIVFYDNALDFLTAKDGFSIKKALHRFRRGWLLSMRCTYLATALIISPKHSYGNSGDENKSHYYGFKNDFNDAQNYHYHRRPGVPANINAATIRPFQHLRNLALLPEWNHDTPFILKQPVHTMQI